MDNFGVELKNAGRYEEAVGVLRRAIDINPEHCNAYYNLGVTLHASSRHQEALGPYNRALQCYIDRGSRPDYIADTHYNLGAVLLKLRRFREARWHFETLLGMAPHYPNGRVMLHMARLKQTR